MYMRRGRGAGPHLLRSMPRREAMENEGPRVLILVSGATADVRLSDPAKVGVLFTPGNRNKEPLAGRVWAVDNAAFSGFDASAFVALLSRLRGYRGCRFVVAPDVVADPVETRTLFETWEPMIRALGYPVALAAQDGLTPGDVPWQRIDALFIGGSTEWKMSGHVDNLLGVAGALGKWRHVGRVNTRRRMRHFWGRCESADGSGFSKWPKRARLAERWIDEFRRSPTLEG